MIPSRGSRPPARHFDDTAILHRKLRLRRGVSRMPPRRRNRAGARRLRGAAWIPVAAVGDGHRRNRWLLRRPDCVFRRPPLGPGADCTVAAPRPGAPDHRRQARTAFDLGRFRAAVCRRPPDRLADRHRGQRPSKHSVLCFPTPRARSSGRFCSVAPVTCSAARSRRCSSMRSATRRSPSRCSPCSSLRSSACAACAASIRSSGSRKQARNRICPRDPH